MGKRTGKAGVYVAILVVIVVVIVFATTRGKGGDEAGVVVEGPGDRTYDAKSYEVWSKEVESAILASSPEGVAPTGPVTRITDLDPMSGRRIPIDPFSGVPMHCEAWVTSAGTDAKGDWRIELDLDEPGTVADGAELNVSVPKRFAKNQELPAVGSKFAFVAHVLHWEWNEGRKIKVWADEARRR